MKKLLILTLLAVCGLCGQARAAQAFIVVDSQTGQILASSDANEKRQIASLTKMATALVVLDMAELKKLDLSERVTVPSVAMRVGDTGLVGLQPGDMVSMRDLIYCSLLASDNVAAMTLAHAVGARLPSPEGLSPIGNFVTQMNALARGLGMKRTLFLNPTGLDADPDRSPPHSTAADVARLTRYAYSEADFPFYVSQKTRTVHIFRAGQDIPVNLTNTNELVGQDDIDGVKTGTTARAGECLVLSAERTPEVKRDGNTTYVTQRRIIVVLLGSHSRFPEGMALTRRGWELYDAWAAKGRTSGSTL